MRVRRTGGKGKGEGRGEGGMGGEGKGRETGRREGKEMERKEQNLLHYFSTQHPVNNNNCIYL